MTPRQLEDLAVRCAICGTFPSTTFGPRDWLSRHQPYDHGDQINDQQQELGHLILTAKGEVEELRRFTTRPIEDDDDDDDRERQPWELPCVVTRERIVADPDDEPWPCDNRDCEGVLDLSWSALIAGHERLTADELRWLTRYTHGKSLVRLGMFRPRVGYATALGTFSAVHSGELESAYGTIPPGATPVYVPSVALAKAVGAIDPATVLGQLATDERCRPTADPDADSLALPIFFEPPKTRVDIELPLDLAAIAGELARDGATPLRGLGVLRLLEVDWLSVTGKLLYFDFDVPLRESMVADVRGERW